MDGFFTFLVIIGIISSIFKWAKKQQQAAGGSSNQGAAQEKPWQRMMGDMVKTLEENVTGKPPEKAMPPAPVYKTLKAPVLKEGMGGGEGLAVPGSITYQRPAHIVGGEGDASPYSLASEGLSMPQESMSKWHGSLPGTEGTIAFTTKAADTRVAAEPVQTSHPTLGLTFNRDSLMQAVVMHEILTRPQDRKRRW